MYAARTRNGFTPESRVELFKEDQAVRIGQMPVRELAEKSGRWGAGLTLAKMQECRWVKPSLGWPV